MTGLALKQTAFPRLFEELLQRHRQLGIYGLACFGLMLAALILQLLDPRSLASGANVWVKPTKFFASVGLLALTAAWFTGYVRDERRRSWPMRATVAMILVAGSFELVWITLQAARGLESHFNFDTPFYQTMYNVMGLFALVLVGSTLPLAWEIAHRPAASMSRDFIAAVVFALLLSCVLGGGFGIAIAVNGGHSVGPEASGFPLFGWNRAGGDLRIAHFLGIHAEQALPLLSALTAGYAARRRVAILTLGTVAYVALTLAAFVQAKAGMPLF